MRPILFDGITPEMTEEERVRRVAFIMARDALLHLDTVSEYVNDPEFQKGIKACGFTPHSDWLQEILFLQGTLKTFMHLLK